ncbi:hypothetical protein EYV94_24680 [Puteibacter caeruleilacunae]|nr:hypothetical protein EYV94_24680 [Puteibacter caeruleilacunae]
MMKRVNVILALVVATLTCSLHVSFAQNQKQYSPEKVFQFLDENNDQKLSKQEVKGAKRLADNFKYLDADNDGFLRLEELKGSNSSARYTYLESAGIFMYYETEEAELYRKLLPDVFDMPDRLLVYTFICDFYKMDSNTQPYKETSIFLLGEYKGKEIWHCVYMPVTSRESMLAGKYRLGLPKTMGNIDFLYADPEYNGTLIDENNCKVSLSINTDNHSFSKDEEKLIKELSVIPKMNILKGEVIEMSGGRNGNVLDLAQKFPNRVVVKGGEGSISFDTSSQKNSNNDSPLGLKPCKILGSYYLSNKIPFRLGKK